MMFDNISEAGKVFYSIMGFLPIGLFLFLWLCAAFDCAIRGQKNATVATKTFSGLAGISLIGWIVLLANIWK